jgi:hypothetical protein
MACSCSGVINPAILERVSCLIWRIFMTLCGWVSAGSLHTDVASARAAAMMLRCDSMTDSGMPACFQQGSMPEPWPALAGAEALGAAAGADVDGDES